MIYENFTSVLKHHEGGIAKGAIMEIAKSLDIRVRVYPEPYIGHWDIQIQEDASESKRKKFLELLRAA